MAAQRMTWQNSCVLACVVSEMYARDVRKVKNEIEKLKKFVENKVSFAFFTRREPQKLLNLNTLLCIPFFQFFFTFFEFSVSA